MLLNWSKRGFLTLSLLGAAFAGGMGAMPPFGPGQPMHPAGLGQHPAGFRAFGAFEKPFPVVRLRGLPFNAGELDIFEFFQARARGGSFSVATVRLAEGTPPLRRRQSPSRSSISSSSSA